MRRELFQDPEWRPPGPILRIALLHCVAEPLCVINEAATTPRSITSDRMKSLDHMRLGVSEGAAALDGHPLGGRN